jgi:hypothetical protein
MTGKEACKLIGHITFAMLAQRASLSMINYSYSFIREHWSSRAVLYPSVVGELRRIRAILPLLRVSLRSRWIPGGYCFDACESGYAVHKGDLSVTEVKAIGRWHERWRYKR